MNLDVNTLFLVTIYVEAILGLLLLFAWVQNTAITAVAWWGFAHLLRAASVTLFGLYGSVSDFISIDLANAILFTAFAVTWTGARLFDHRRPKPLLLFAGAAFWLVASRIPGFVDSFDMRVLAYDPFISEAAARELSVDLVSLEQLLAESDFISLHTAVVPETRNMVNAANIARMKKGVRIVNAARGELINEADLAAAIQSGHVAGAALDVFAEEPPKNCPLIGLPNVITTPHVAGSTAEAQEELGTQVAVQIRDYLTEGIIRNAVNLPALSADQYRRVRPYLALAERLGSMVSQAAAFRPARIRIRYAGEVAEVGTHLLRSAVLAGVLNAVLDEKVNVVNAPAVAAARGLRVEEETRKRDLGFPNTLEVSALPAQGAATPHGFTVEGTVLHDGSPRVLMIEGIPLEAHLEGTMLYLRNDDKPGVIGQVGSTLGQLGVNIATFALGRSAAQQGAHAVSLVRLDGEVSASILEPIRAIPAITEARLLHL